MKKAVLKKYAKELRGHQTDVEIKIWRYLRSRRFQGFKFRRQQPLGPYIADFCSFERKVVVELDGGQHGSNLENDDNRTASLNKAGFMVIRIWNNEFLENRTAALEHIFQNLIKSPSPRPSPLEGEGELVKSQLI